MTIHIKRGLRIIPLFFIALLVGVSSLCAQEVSMTINPDRTVVFRYADSTAKSVKLYCDGNIRKECTSVKGEGYHSAKMKRDKDGVWSYTTPPMVPEVYTYQFKTNGELFHDPTNPDSIRVHDSKRSFFIIDGTPQTDLYTSDQLQGHLDTLQFQCPCEDKVRKIIVYTPPQYYESREEFPVFYLLHGLNGNECAWIDRGRAVQILDNLIQQQKAKPMILVMPDGNPVCLISQGEDVGLMQNILLFGSWKKQEFEQCYPNMDAYLSSLYRFSHKDGSRAVAGLSAGARQSANLANMYDSTFSHVGLFSPVINGKQVPNSHYTEFWIGCGNDDIFHPSINRFRNKMQRRHIPYTMYNSDGGHTWRNWRVYFTKYVQTLFWK